jgi:hypothetical protein
MRKEILIVLSILLVSTSFAVVSTPDLQITTEQINMYSSETGYLKMTIANTGSSTAYDTQITLYGLSAPLASSKLCNECLTYSGTQNICLEYNSICYNNIGDINVNNLKSFIIPVQIPASAEENYYSASLQIKYKELPNDPYYIYFDRLELIQVSAKLNSTSFGLYTENVRTQTSGLSFDVKVANIGLLDAKAVSIALSEDGRLISNNYIGDLTSGAYAKTTFTITSINTTSAFPGDSGFNRTRINNSAAQTNMSNNLSGPRSLFFIVNYTNSEGIRVSESISTALDLSLLAASQTTSSSFSRTTSTSLDYTSIFSWAFVAGVVIVVGYFFIKSRRNRKTKG